MVVLTGKNLGERQRDLNLKVAEVIANKSKFDDIKNEEEISDVDKLYKIDIASQYKDVDYMVEVLKSGDSLYISRSLKCLWLYDDNYSNIVNPENLHHNIFPFMSIRMMKKMLSTISINIRNSDRASSFYEYCINNEMLNIAFKFLKLLTEEIKLDALKHGKLSQLRSYIATKTNLQSFIGNSFALATTYIEIDGHSRRRNNIYDLRYLYAINNEEYLNIVEKYTSDDLQNHHNMLKRFGIRISRDIILKNKDRVLRNPVLYVSILNKSMLVKYSSISDGKIYINSLFPEEVKEFWQQNLCTDYSYILNLIPKNERLEYIKQLFTTKYPGEAFEMDIKFYNLKYYNMMSVEEKDLWALRHIAEGKDILGDGNDYIWYKFVNFEKAFSEIDKYIMVTPNTHKRSCLVNTLVEAARDQKDLKKLLDYYYTRHINENEDVKCNFIDKVLNNHNVFELNIECWDALNKLFYSLDLYNIDKYNNRHYTAVAVMCHILYNIDMPQLLLDFIDLDVNYSYFNLVLPKLDKDKSEVVLQYLIKLFVDKLKPFEQDPHNKKLRKKLLKYVNNICTLLSCFGKKDEECPEIVKKFMDIHSAVKKDETVDAKDMFRFIKTDVKQLNDVLDDSSSDVNICNYSQLIHRILRKLKVYFHNDVAPAYINYLDRTIKQWFKKDQYEGSRLIKAAIFGIFLLGDKNFILSLMEKYKPLEPKIDHSSIDVKYRDIQEAICRFMGYSRPSIPLENVLEYITGDYVKYCLPMFKMYLVSLPYPLVIKFTESLLNKPLSIQKHGLRLAFECYSSENLKTLLLNTWKRSKNVSLRKIIYESLFDRFTKRNNSKDDAEILYEVLKSFTSDLHQDDDEKIFELIISGKVPNGFRGDYLQVIWNMVIKLPNKPIYMERQNKVLKRIQENFTLVQRDFVRKIIRERVQDKLEYGQLCSKELLDFTGNYVVEYSNREELEENLALISYIFKKCLEKWDLKCGNKITFHKFYFDFIEIIDDRITDIGELKSSGLPIITHILDKLRESLPLKEIYFIIWRLKLTMSLEIALNDIKPKLPDEQIQLCNISDEYIITIVCDSIANQIEKIVQEFKLKQQLYPIFYPEIASVLESKLCIFGPKHMVTHFCQSLANIGLKETHLLILTILPISVSKEIEHIHTKILNKIQAFEDEEIQCFMHFHFKHLNEMNLEV